MPKYLFHGAYTLDGVKGVIKDGGSKRKAVAQKAIESVGGKLEAFYFAFGKDDVVVLADLPDNASVAALSLAIAAAGGFSGKTTVLVTPEEMDRAAQKVVGYTAPGR